MFKIKCHQIARYLGDAGQSLIGRVACYTPSPGFGLHLLNSAQDGGKDMESI